MKMIALIAATGSLAAMTAPANAAEIQSHTAPAMTAPEAMIAPLSTNFDIGSTVHYDRYDRYDRRYDRRDRRYDRRDRRYDRHGRYYEPRRIGHRDRIWRGRDGNYYCERDNGTTGLVIGAGVGALLGRTIDTRGDRTVGTLLGGALGAVLGREIDRGELRCR